MSIEEQDLQTLWFKVGQRFADDNPAFVKCWNYAVSNSRPWQVHQYVNPVAQLIEYLRSLMDACQQALYSIEKIKELHDKERNNITTWYASHHFYNFIARAKTATDLLALLIRHIFAIEETKLKDEECSLHKSRIIGILRNQNPTPLKKNLADILAQAQKGWIQDFYPLRNFVIHQPGFLFTNAPFSSPDKWSQGSHIFIPFPYEKIDFIGNRDKIGKC
jgi:hypothetical protein